MARDYLLRSAGAFLLALSGQARADPSLEVSPASVQPGDALLVTVRGSPEPPSAALGGRTLRFYPVPGGYRALSGLPVETPPGSLALEASLPGEAGQLRASLEVAAPHFGSAELGVAHRFLAPPPAARRRMQRDQAAFLQAFAQPFEPPLFSAPFAAPRDAEVTGHFGDRRLFNGKRQSQHYGEDLAGQVGDPVLSANDGRVVLVRDCYASGRTVVVWHGAGLFSVYFHLSRFEVKPGEAVRRGQRLGLVGRTGRVTGPHLHWGMKVGDLYVDPRSVLRLDFGG
jgi:murein DD-endopeptidase MepM/ murein hydrolase activator NlpD